MGSLINGFETAFGLNTDQDNNIEDPVDLTAGNLTDEELADLKDNEEPDILDQGEPVEDPAEKPAEKKPVEEEGEEPAEKEPAEEEEEDKSDEGSDIVSSFFDAIAETSGIQVDENEKPKTAEDIVGFFNKYIEEKSKPVYASDELQSLDEFVRNGGRPQDFYKLQSPVDYSEDQLAESKEAQVNILKEYMLKQGFSENRINEKLELYDASDLLEVEAKDALRLMQEDAKLQQEELLVQQQKAAQQMEEQRQSFVTSVVQEIRDLDNVQGVKVPANDKKALVDYIFKVEADGLTKYQRDFQSNVSNLITSAYFTMSGDKLIKAAQRKGQNSAVERFRQNLKRSGNSTSPTTKVRTSNKPNNELWSSLVDKLRGN